MDLFLPVVLTLSTLLSLLVNWCCPHRCYAQRFFEALRRCILQREHVQFNCMSWFRNTVSKNPCSRDIFFWGGGVSHKVICTSATNGLGAVCLQLFQFPLLPRVLINSSPIGVWGACKRWGGRKIRHSLTLTWNGQFNTASVGELEYFPLLPLGPLTGWVSKLELWLVQTYPQDKYCCLLDFPGQVSTHSYTPVC